MRRRRETRDQPKPYLLRCLVLDRVWSHSVWTSRSCLSQRCRNHPWGRGYPWLLSTASLPIKANTHRIIHTEGTDEDGSIGPNSFTSFPTFLYYIGFPGWVSNGPLQTKIVSRHNKRKQTLHVKAHFIFLIFSLSHIKLLPSEKLSLSFMHVCTCWVHQLIMNRAIRGTLHVQRVSSVCHLSHLLIEKSHTPLTQTTNF